MTGGGVSGEDDNIRIEDLWLHQQYGRPNPYQGRHDPRTLAGIDLEFSFRDPRLSERVEDVFSRETVEVHDPFEGRSYQATAKIEYSSVADGEWRYKAQVREVDMPPHVDAVEIEGQRYPVLGYAEEDMDGEAIGRFASLRLTKDEWRTMQVLFGRSSVLVRRIPVDEEPVRLRFGGAQYWSRHEEGEDVYYKQIVRFFPPEYERERRTILDIEEVNLSRTVIALLVRYEALVEELMASGVITEERRAELLGTYKHDIDAEDWAIARSRLDRVTDAEEYLPPD